jgi:peroxiredoxin
LPLTLAACATAAAPSGIQIGDPLQFSLLDLKGDRFTPQDLEGKVVLVDLWATWCKPCKESLPFYAALHDQHKASGFAVLAISVDVHEDEVFDFIEAHPVSFTVLRDPQGTVPSRIGIGTLPTLLILGRDGRVAFIHTGFEQGDKEAIAQAVIAALRVPTSTVAGTP